LQLPRPGRDTLDTPAHTSRRLPKYKQNKTKQGFTHYRPSPAGTLEPTHLDVDTLNARLAPCGAARHRLALKPDEAHGAVFVLEGVLADTGGAVAAAWARVAASHGRPPPPLDARPALLAVRPERAVMDLLGWTRDWGEARALAADVAGAYLEEVGSLDAARPGVARWWAALAAARVPVAVVSELDRGTVSALLARCGLVGQGRASGGGGGKDGESHHHHHRRRHQQQAPPPPPRPPFASVAVVAAEDGAETRAQALLAAALKLGRPPAACVAFAGDPPTVAAAHNASMAAVAVASPRHPAWSLAEADLTVGAMDELTVQNVRRLFAARGAEFMDLAQERVSHSNGSGSDSSRGGRRRLWADRPRGAAVDERDEERE
jgi:beta-phosphoglucomutase-like phosphatase (HAD superfamily)